MAYFSQALGVECGHCHVLNHWDQDTPHKQFRARRASPWDVRGGVECKLVPDPDAHTERGDAPNAGIRQIRPEFVKNGYSDIIYFTHATHVPNDVFAYSRDARHCFDERRYLATITTASAIVEVILNKDSRMQEKRRGWRSLSPRLLKEGAVKGLPIQQLLDAKETLPAASIEFVDLRNRVAHGNLRGIVGLENTGTPDYSSEGRLAALNQLKKAEAFVMEWYNTAPDVQEGKIVHHRWPSGLEGALDT